MYNRRNALCIALLVKQASIEYTARQSVKLEQIRRMKLSYRACKTVSLDDSNYIRFVDEEWSCLKNKPDYHAFVHYFEKYILYEK